MGIAETLELIISADAKGAISALEGVAQSAEKNMTAAEGRIQRFQKTGASLLKTGFAGIGVGGLLTQVASGDEEAAASLKASVQSVGQSYDDFKEKIEKAAASQAKFGHTDEDATKALSTLTLATGDTQKALDLMQVTADYAAKKGISLADAGTAIGKIFNGSTKPLKEFGIQVKTNADGTKDYQGAVDQLGQKLTGQASAAVDSWGGKLKILGAEAENFVSQIGQKFGPAILGLSTGMTALGGITSGVASIVGKITASHATAAVTAEKQAAAEAEAAAALEAETAATLSALDANAAYVASGGAVTFSEAEVAAAVQARTAAEYQALVGNEALVASDEEVAAAAEASAVAQESSTVATSSAKAGLGALALVAVGAGLAIKEFGQDTSNVNVNVQKFATLSRDQMVEAFNKISSAGDKLGTDFQQQFIDKLRDGGAAGVGALQQIRDAYAATGRDTAVLDAAISEASQSQQNLTTATDEGNTALSGLSSTTQGATQSNAEYAKSLDELSKTLKAQTDPFFGVIHAADSLATAQQTATEKQDALTKAIKTYGPNSVEAAAATRDLQSANLAAAEAAGGMDNALRTLESSVLSGTTSVGQAQAQLATWVNEGRITVDQAAQIQTQFAYVGQAADALNGRHIEMTVTTYYDARGQAVTNALGDQGQLQHRAGGGPVSAGTAYLVGERGPEVFVPSGSGAIRPNGAGTGAAYQVTVNAGIGADGTRIGQQVVEAIRAYERSNGTAWRDN